MELQMQYQAPAFKVLGNSISLEEFFHPYHQVGNMFEGHPILNGAVFGGQESELTSNMSASRKRNRQQDDFQLLLSEQMLHLHHPQFSQQILPSKMGKLSQVSANHDNQTNGSGGTSTSGQSCHLPSSLPSTQSQDLGSYLFIQNLEIEALIQQQNEKVRSKLEETRKRHCRSLISVLEQQILKSLQAKEMELANANRRNAELEEKLKQMNSENQILFNIANKNEAMVCSLKSSLEQIILYNQSQNQIKEGFGDSDEDAQSSCNQEAEKTVCERERRSCKVCHENDMSVMVLPCRHLCLCKHCELKKD